MTDSTSAMTRILPAKVGPTFLSRVRHRLQLRRNAHSLGALDDRMLNDIGLTRYDVAQLARGRTSD